MGRKKKMPVQEVETDYLDFDKTPDAASELAKLRAENTRLMHELASKNAAEVALPNSGRGRYRVELRHSPAPVKRLELDADSEQDAWDRFLQANFQKQGNQAGWRRLQEQVARGELDRVIVKVG
jgi:hypothetical protein